MAKEIERDALAREAPFASVTYDRPVRDDLEDKLPKPCKLSVSIKFGVFDL